jgi:hypothetical protein
MTRQIRYKCDICGKEYHYNSVEVTDKERGILVRIPELKIEICLMCKKQLLEAVNALKKSYVI